MSGTIQPNQWLMVRLPSQNHKVLQLVPHTTVSLGKFGTFMADNLIGEKFGYTFDIHTDKTISPTQPPEFSADNDVEEQTMEGDKIEFMGNNTLSMDEIEELKKQGLDGGQIIDRITQAHQDFSKKTEFSKEKYLKRKKAKYLQQFTPEPLSATQLIDIYVDKDSSRVMNMGPESLALLLSLANVRPGGHYLVVDETPSVVIAAILEKLGGHGSVTFVHENEHPNLDGLKYFPHWMPKEDLSDGEPLVRLINLLDLLRPEECPPFVEKDVKALKSTQRGQYYRQLYRETQRQWIANKANNAEFDGLIIASTLDLRDLVPRLVPFLAGSSQVAVFSEYKESLVDLTLALKNDLRFLGPTIMETRVRKYQTLPGRMHPMMSSYGYGGYILTAIRVFPCPTVHALGVAAQRKKRKVEAPAQEKAVDDAKNADSEMEVSETSLSEAQTAEPETPDPSSSQAKQPL